MNEEMQCIDKKLYKELKSRKHWTILASIKQRHLYRDLMALCLTYVWFKAKTKSIMDIKLKEASVSTLTFKYNK